MDRLSSQKLFLCRKSINMVSLGVCLPLEEIMRMKIHQHLNGFFSKDVELRKKGYDIILLDKEKQSGNKYNRYVREIEHISKPRNNT